MLIWVISLWSRNRSSKHLLKLKPNNSPSNNAGVEGGVSRSDRFASCSSFNSSSPSSLYLNCRCCNNNSSSRSSNNSLKLKDSSKRDRSASSRGHQRSSRSNADSPRPHSQSLVPMSLFYHLAQRQVASFNSLKFSPDLSHRYLSRGKRDKRSVVRRLSLSCRNNSSPCNNSPSHEVSRNKSALKDAKREPNLSSHLFHLSLSSRFSSLRFRQSLTHPRQLICGDFSMKKTSILSLLTSKNYPNSLKNS